MQIIVPQASGSPIGCRGTLRQSTPEASDWSPEYSLKTRKSNLRASGKAASCVEVSASISTMAGGQSVQKSRSGCLDASIGHFVGMVGRNQHWCSTVSG